MMHATTAAAASSLEAISHREIHSLLLVQDCSRIVAYEAALYSSPCLCRLWMLPKLLFYHSAGQLGVWLIKVALPDQQC